MKLDIVVKIGSMALIQKGENAIDYNVFQRLGGDLRRSFVLWNPCRRWPSRSFRGLSAGTVRNLSAAR